MKWRSNAQDSRWTFDTLLFLPNNNKTLERLIEIQVSSPIDQPVDPRTQVWLSCNEVRVQSLVGLRHRWWCKRVPSFGGQGSSSAYQRLGFLPSHTTNLFGWQVMYCDWRDVPACDWHHCGIWYNVEKAFWWLDPLGYPGRSSTKHETTLPKEGCPLDGFCRQLKKETSGIPIESHNSADICRLTPAR